MHFSVETWDPAYGASAETVEMEQSDESVDASVETPLDRWEPLTPTASAEFGTVAFVDGVRRIDARVWIVEGEAARPGVCATVAAGVVLCRGSRAEVVDAVVARAVVAAASDAGPIATRHGCYELRPVPEDTPEALYLGVHGLMTALEVRSSGGVEADLVVFDGPLRGRGADCGVGYVKSQHVQYLPDEVQPVVGRLGAAQRSPLFLVGGRFPRWSWYMRLPCQVVHPLAGVVRCEMTGSGTVAEAVRRADDVAATLMRFGSEPHKDGRAPQNLYPIAGLERELRRRLGDARLLERSLRLAAAHVSS